MSMEAIAPVRNLSARDRAREACALRRKLMRPPNGRASAEIEVVPSFEFRKRLARAREMEASAIIQSRFGLGNALVEEYRLAVDAWARNLTETLPPPTRLLPTIRIDHVIDAVCAHYGIASDDLLSSKRGKEFSYPRHVTMFLARSLTILSLPQISSRLGGRDHTTTLHGVRKIKTAIALADPKVAADIAAIKQRLGVT